MILFKCNSIGWNSPQKPFCGWSVPHPCDLQPECAVSGPHPGIHLVPPRPQWESLHCRCHKGECTGCTRNSFNSLIEFWFFFQLFSFLFFFCGKIFEFLYKLVYIGNSYFGKFDEDVVKNNYALVYELLDGELRVILLFCFRVWKINLSFARNHRLWVPPEQRCRDFEALHHSRWDCSWQARCKTLASPIMTIHRDFNFSFFSFFSALHDFDFFRRRARWSPSRPLVPSRGERKGSSTGRTSALLTSLRHWTSWCPTKVP